MRGNNPLWKFFLGLAVFCALTSEFLAHIVTRSPNGQIEYAQKQILNLEKQIQESLNTISTFTTDSQYHEFFIHHGQQNLGFSFFYFENAALKYWSDNEVSFQLKDSALEVANGSVLNLSNGTYEAFTLEPSGKKIIGLILLRKNYSYENKYLVNHFNPVLGLSERFSAGKTSESYQLNSSSGSHLISLSYSHEIADELPFNPAAWFYLSAILFFFSFLFFWNRSIKNIQVLLLAVFLIVLRYLMIAFRLPGEMYYTDFFSPKVYGSSFFFNSIGDFFLNAVTLFCFSGVLYSHLRTKTFFAKHSSKNSLLFVFVIGLLAILFLTIHALISGLVLNSKITFDIGNSLDLNANTFTGLFSIMLLLWSFYFLSAGILFPFRNNFLPRILSEHKNKFQSRFFVLLFLGLYAAFTIDHYNDEKEMEDQKLFAQRLDTRQDRLAEYLFDDVEKQISNDETVRRLTKSIKDVSDVVEKYLQKKYFTGYWAKFDVNVSVFNSHGLLSDSSSSTSLVQIAQQAAQQGRPTFCEKLFFLPNESGRLSYLSIFPVADDSVTLVVYLDSRIIQPTEGFPELFVSNRITQNRDDGNYSFARYSNGSLIYAGGSFPYSFHPNLFSSAEKEFSIFSFGGFNHIVYKASQTSLIVVSHVAENFFNKVSFFSYILIFFLIFFTAWFLAAYFIERKNSFQFSLKQRIRSSILSLIILSFIFIVVGTGIYIVRKYDADQNKTILSRLNTMWFALTDHFNFDRDLSAINRDEWISGLNQVVSNFNLDFNLYDENGNLFYSSQPKLFDRGIVSTRINPEALFEMLQYGRTQFVHPESIGKLNYAAAYAPFTDHEGKITGYLNLPYFEKQNELNKEISGFLSALINIYMLLLVLSLILALIITSRITKPLLLIQEKLSSIRLGKRNEMIEWKRNDEIGQLVQEYNRMVEELVISADKLARSERESAWREMAKQVAHEIKNPLTPMKLSVQHLQRAWNEKSGNLDELFQRISKMMIEQIDALSNIASEFSNFAQMPRAKNETLDLGDIVRSSINVFNNTPNVSIQFEDDKIERKVFADREQLIRALSNLIKNAVQSIENNKNGIINISMKTENGFHIISVADNGTGIPAEIQSKIFTPNFTTKTSGMGLGLAMVKSMVESIGGTINFETKIGDGSVFYLSLPIEEDSNSRQE